MGHMALTTDFTIFTLADDFKDITHSLDVWHKSKNIRKCLIQVYHTNAYNINLFITVNVNAIITVQLNDLTNKKQNNVISI